MPLGIHAFGDREHLLPADFHDNNRFRDRNHLVIAVLAAFNDHPIAFDFKELRAKPQHAARHQLKTRLRAVIGIAAILARLDLVKDLRQPRVLRIDRNPHRRQPRAQVRLPGLIGHRNKPGVAHRFGRDMLVGGGVFQDRRGMQPRLVRESRGADIGGRTQRHPVQNVVKTARQPRYACQLRLGNACFVTAFVGLFQQKRRDQRGQVGIAAALAQTVQRALHLPRPGVDRGQRIRHRRPGIVMAMDAEVIARHPRGDHGGGDRAHFGGQGAAVRVAQDHPARASLIGRAATGQRIVGVRLVAVKEMLGVKQRLAPLGHHMGDRSANVFKVFLQRDAKRGSHMVIMRLAHQTDRGRGRIHHRRQHVIIRGRASGAFRHAKGGEGRPRFGPRVKEIAVGRVRPGPATLDVIDADLVQRLSNRDLFRHRELHALGLLTVAQGGVV